MKLFPSVLATSVLALSVLGGCAMTPHNESAAAPKINISTESHNISAGTTTRLTANTMNVVGGSKVQWFVSPTVGSIKPESDNGVTALFSADQPGTYIVTATVKLPDGNWATDKTNISVNGVDVNGHPVTDNK